MSRNSPGDISLAIKESKQIKSSETVKKIEAEMYIKMPNGARVRRQNGSQYQNHPKKTRKEEVNKELFIFFLKK